VTSNEYVKSDGLQKLESSVKAVNLTLLDVKEREYDYVFGATPRMVMVSVDVAQLKQIT
jgi:hypothetical protein